MKAYRTQKIMPQKGPLLLYDLPFRSNALIEIIILSNEDKNNNKCYPMRGSIDQYDDPFEPVAIEDWNVYK